MHQRRAALIKKAKHFMKCFPIILDTFEEPFSQALKAS